MDIDRDEQRLRYLSLFAVVGKYSALMWHQNSVCDSVVTFRSCLLRERLAKHRIPALGLFLGSLVLNDVPVFDKNPILQANDVRCDPVHRQSDVGEPTMNDDVVVFSKNDAGLILERRR